MTLTEAGEIFDYWAECPPTYLMLQIIARALGWRPPGESASITGFADVANAAPPGLAVARGGITGVPPAVFDVDALRARNRARAARIMLGTGGLETAET